MNVCIRFILIPPLSLRFTFAIPSLHLRYFFATDLFHSRLQINGAWDVYTFEKNRRMNVD